MKIKKEIEISPLEFIDGMVEDGPERIRVFLLLLSDRLKGIEQHMEESDMSNTKYVFLARSLISHASVAMQNVEWPGMDEPTEPPKGSWA